MDRILNITNGDCAADVMRQAGIAGKILPWRDVLHDGPVPEGLSLDALSMLRAQFITEKGWGEREAIKQDFIARDNALKAYPQYQKVILWFEHDLYDQLQLLQILDWFNQQHSLDTELTMICVDQYLGMLSPEQMVQLHQYEQMVTDEQLSLASTAWNAYRSSTPEKWYALLKADSHVLPYLAGAIRRQLQEYPDSRNGLSRTAQQALNIITKGESRPGRVFALYQETERRRFMGDSSFWVVLNELLESTPPLLALAEGNSLKLPLPVYADQVLSITPEGEAVLAGDSNWLDTNVLDHWLGGVHLTAENVCCWDREKEEIIY
ncbi:MAG: DUF1835 domain-containing protein [Gammaproteobacteria bacterium]